MSIGIENKDSSFFTIESNDIELQGYDFAKNLISLSITERSNGMPTGQLTFWDPDDIYSRILRTGLSLKISWGYKSVFEIPDSLLAKKLNFDEVSGTLIRRGLQGFVSSPTGKADNKGLKTYNCNFTSYGFRGTKESKLYGKSYGYFKNIIADAFDDIGVSPVKRKILFSLGDEPISNNGIRKDETTFLFLSRLAKEWRAFFQLGFTPLGEVCGVFIDPNTINDCNMQTWMMNATGKSNIIGYMGELNNVISYDWTSAEAENGSGDNVGVDIVDGKIIYRRFVAQEKSIVSYRLNVKKIQKIYNETENLTSMVKVTNELLDMNDFQKLIDDRFFIPIQNSTAPNGYGFRVKCNMIGNPLFAPPNQIIINNGFPDVLGGEKALSGQIKLKDVIWYIQTVTHNIDRSGYNMSIEFVDVFTLSPIGITIR